MLGGVALIEVGLGVSLALYLVGIGWFLHGVSKVSGQHPKWAGGQRPRVTVVVAARDEAQRIGACLGDLLDQAYPRQQREIIVVDDGSSDGTADLARGVSPELQVISLPTSGKKAALEAGIARARGEIILTTDADCRLPSTWIEGMVACFTPGVGLVVGFSQIVAPGQVPHLRAGWEGLDFLSLMTCIMGSIGQGQAMAASGQNLAYRKQAFGEVGGYAGVRHRASGDDVLLLHKVRRETAWEVAFCRHPGTFVVHPAAPSWRGLLGQRRRWASNAPLMARWQPLFFAYMVCTFLLEIQLALTPLLVLSGLLGVDGALLAWGGKIAGEAVLLYSGARIFARSDLLSYWPFWALSNPFYKVLMGGAGLFGRFKWKGVQHRWGRRLPNK
ncbi:MAG: glycosyltransferase [Candidatus Latescibacteria bacterium]|nr:glycosyltransferase [Candidatus Latescibacterota bacterium]